MITLRTVLARVEQQLQVTGTPGLNAERPGGVCASWQLPAVDR
jgi:hypothetical protein